MERLFAQGNKYLHWKQHQKETMQKKVGPRSLSGGEKEHAGKSFCFDLKTAAWKIKWCMTHSPQLGTLPSRFNGPILLCEKIEAPL